MECLLVASPAESVNCTGLAKASADHVLAAGIAHHCPGRGYPTVHTSPIRSLVKALARPRGAGLAEVSVGELTCARRV